MYSGWNSDLIETRRAFVGLSDNTAEFFPGKTTMLFVVIQYLLVLPSKSDACLKKLGIARTKPTYCACAPFVMVKLKYRWREDFTFKFMVSGNSAQAAFDEHTFIIVTSHDVTNEPSFDRENLGWIGSRADVRESPIEAESIVHNTPNDARPFIISGGYNFF